MENPQAQMPQGQPGPAQGQAPQQGGQDPQMQQLMQAVQQMIQQGAQPTDVAAELLGKQVPPEIIMQVFVQMGLPEQEAQMAIEQAMQGGQQPQGPGEEQMEGQASNPQEEMAEQGMPPQGMPPAEGGQPQMRFGGFFSGNTARRLKNKKNVVINNYTINGQPQEDENYIGGGYAPDAEDDVYYNPGLRTSAGNAMFPNNGDAYTQPMRNGGMLRRYAAGAAVDPNQELQAVMEQVQGMIEQGADAQQVMAQIQAAAQQGQISPDVATQVLEQLGGMQQAQNPQGSDAAMTEGSQDPQMMDPNMAAPDAQMGMARFGGNLKKLMKKAYGGDAIPPSLDSKNYVQERANMFVNSVKNNAFKSTLDDEFPSLGGNQMAYGGDLPKAEDGIFMKDDKLTIDPTKFKSESDYKAAVYDWNNNPANKDNQVTTEMFTANKWTQQPDANASYKYDPATKQYVVQPAAKNTNQSIFAEGDVLNYDNLGAYITRKDGSMQRIPGNYNQNAGYNASQSQINPVAYQNPMGNTLYDNLYASANPLARLLAGSGNRYGDPRVTGANLPGGMSGADFLGRAGDLGNLKTGMTGTIGDQTWRVAGQEKFKEGSIWKGNRRKGIRYDIDWGNAAGANPASNNAPGYNPTAAGPGYSGYNADANGDGIPDYLSKNNSAPATNNSALATNTAGLVMGPNNQPLTSDASNMMWNSGNMPTLQNPNPITNANQTLVNPAQSNVINPAADVNEDDKNINAVDRLSANYYMYDDKGLTGADNPYLGTYTNPENYFKDGNVKNNAKKYYEEAFPNLPNKDRRDLVRYANESNQIVTGITGRPEDADAMYTIPKSTRQLRKDKRAAANEPPAPNLTVSDQAPKAGPNIASLTPSPGTPVVGVTPNPMWNNNPGDKPWENAPKPPTKEEIRQDRRDDRQDRRDDRQEMFSNIKGLFSGKRYDNGGAIYRAMGGEGDCPEGMVWSEEEQTCVSIANTPESKPLDASIAVGENGQFSANYSGNVGPTGITTNTVGFGYNPNENTSLEGNYDAANRSIMLQGNKAWNVGGGQLGVSGGYTAPVGGGNFNQGNFNGNVYYNTQLGKGANAVPVKVNFGVGNQAYGGNVNPADLANAVSLINRAFGGMLPHAEDGNMGNQGYLESSLGKKFNVDWNAAADVYATSGAKFANFMDKVSSFQGNQERELAKRSALNRPSDTYDTMEQGVYDQWGNFKPNDLNNQVLNPTDTYRQNQRQIYAYGGRLYEIGGEVDLDDSEIEALRMAGFNFRRS